jgi:cell division protein FtsW (lipid II flippase)
MWMTVLEWSGKENYKQKTISCRHEELPSFSQQSRIYVTLLTAHRILIGTAVVFFFGFARWELRNYSNSGDLWTLFCIILYLAVSASFGIYLKTLKHWLK